MQNYFLQHVIDPGLSDWDSLWHGGGRWWLCAGGKSFMEGDSLRGRQRALDGGGRSYGGVF